MAKKPGKRRTTKASGQKKKLTTEIKKPAVAIIPFPIKLKALKKDLPRFAGQRFPVDIFKVSPSRQINYFVHQGVTIAVRPHPSKPKVLLLSAVRDFTKDSMVEVNLAKIEGKIYTFKKKKFLRIDKINQILHS